MTATTEGSWTGTENLLDGAFQIFGTATLSRLAVGTIQMVLSPSKTQKNVKTTVKTKILDRIAQCKDAGVTW